MDPNRFKTFKPIYISASIVLCIILALLHIARAGNNLDRHGSNDNPEIHTLTISIWLFSLLYMLFNAGSLYYLVPTIVNDYKYFECHNIPFRHVYKCLSRQKRLAISFVAIAGFVILYVLLLIQMTCCGYNCGLGSPFNDLITAFSFLFTPFFCYYLISAIYVERKAILSI